MNEILSSDWTPAAYKQREEQQRMREADEAALVQGDREILVSDWNLVAFQQREKERRKKEAKAALAELEKRMEERRKKEEAGLAETKLAGLQTEAVRREQEERPPAEVVQLADRVELAALQRDREETHFREEPATIHIEATRKPARGFPSILVTGLIAATIGFGMGVYIVPVKKATHFRALVNGGLNSVIGAKRPDKGSAKVQPAKASQAKAPVQTEPPP